MSNNLLKAFNVKKEKINRENDDYLVFQDKELLEKFRFKILENLSDKGYANQFIDNKIIKHEIDDVTYGYDLSNSERNFLYNLIDNEVNGYGPISELLNDDNIDEIMVNSPKDIYIGIDGNIQKDNTISFINDEHIIRTIEKLLSGTDKIIDANNPIVNAVIDNKAHLNAIIPPISLNPIITIKKYKKSLTDLNDLIGNGTLTPDMANFLEAAVESKLNILITGSDSSGKTTLLNTLSSLINDNERIITIEDGREINLPNKHIVQLVTRTSNYIGKGEITTKQLLHNAIKMRPDRIIISEIKGPESLELLQTLNIGYKGIMTTIYANNGLDAISRLDSLALIEQGNIPAFAIKQVVTDNIDLVISISKIQDNKRKITNISEIYLEKDNYVLKDIFSFNQDKDNNLNYITGEYITSKEKPKCFNKLNEEKKSLLKNLFRK